MYCVQDENGESKTFVFFADLLRTTSPLEVSRRSRVVDVQDQNF